MHLWVAFRIPRRLTGVGSVGIGYHLAPFPLSPPRRPRVECDFAAIELLRSGVKLADQNVPAVILGQAARCRRKKKVGADLFVRCVLWLKIKGTRCGGYNELETRFFLIDPILDQRNP